MIIFTIFDSSQAGPGIASKAIHAAEVKLNIAQEVVESEAAKLDEEERERSNAQVYH